MNNSTRATIVGLAVLLVAGCSSAPKPPPPTQINGSVQASAQLNPNSAKRASPLLVRIYELKSPTAFNAADFVSLYERDQAALGADLVAREEIMLQPGETKAYNKTLAPEVKYIAVFGAYRDLEKSRWRSVVAVQPNKKQNLVVKADELAISAAIAP